ncbi:MAG: hypothetical protein ACJ790_06670 [Myxococcaceae bacterium]
MDDQAIDLRGSEGRVGTAEHHEKDGATEAYRLAWRPAGSRSLSAWGRIGGEAGMRAGPSELALSAYIFED